MRSGLRAGGLIHGVQLRTLTTHVDHRGGFTEIFQQNWPIGIVPVQWSLVTSEPRVLRGVYLHRRHDEYFCLVRGHASVGLHDLRAGSPTNGVWCLIEVFDDDLLAICFPPGIAHGWYFHAPSLHMQAVSESSATYQRDDNLGCHWADPALGIPWPDPAPILSERSGNLGSLRDLVTLLGV